MYTGDERDTPSEKIQSEFLFEKDSSEGFDPEETREYRDEDSEEEPVSDGGFEYRRVFDGDVQDVADEAVAYEGDVHVVGYDGGIAVQGSRSDVTSFVDEVRQQLGAEDTEEFFNVHIHETSSEPEAVSYADQKVAADGGSKSSPSMAGPMGPGTRGPESEYAAVGGEYSGEAEVMGDVTHVLEEAGYEDGAPM